MGTQARIDTIALLTQFRAALATFASTAAVALDEANTDIQRTKLWLREDQYRHWKAQVQTRTEQYTRAKLALKQREVLERAIAGVRSSCVEERKALQIAERRLREAERVLRLVKIYSNQIEKEAQDYKGAVHGLVNAIEAGIPNACAGLERMAQALDQYVALAPPEMPGTPREELESTIVQPCDLPPVEEEQATESNENEDVPEGRRATE